MSNIPERIHFPCDNNDTIIKLNKMCGRYREHGGKSVEYILTSLADKQANKSYENGVKHGLEGRNILNG